MPEKSFIIRLSANAFLFVYFVTEKGNIGRFVVKLNIFRDGVYHEIARYDGGLHEPHMDIIRPDGCKERTIDYGILENDQALNMAIQDFKNNWDVYIERWNKWREEKE
jgi:hypothetical protein